MHVFYRSEGLPLTGYVIPERDGSRAWTTGLRARRRRVPSKDLISYNVEIRNYVSFAHSAAAGEALATRAV